MASPVNKSPVEIHAHATSNLRFIRDTMERASTFTAVPGWGGVFMGLTALLASFICLYLPKEWWLTIWLTCGMIAMGFGSLAIFEKARRNGAPLDSPGARKFALAFAPPLGVGVILTVALIHAGAFRLVPGALLLLYGIGVLGGGAFSVRVIPLMGICFIALGSAALFVPLMWGNVLMGVGFGLLHIIFGGIIARRHGG